MNKKTTCPKCASEDVTEIVYGQLTGNPELVKKMSEGKVKLGGMCRIEGKSPAKRCNVCGYGWGEIPPSEVFCS